MKWFIKITDVREDGLVQGEVYNDQEKGSMLWASSDWTYDSKHKALTPSQGTFHSIGAPPALWLLAYETAELAVKLHHHGVALVVGQGTWGPSRVDMDLLSPRVEQMLYEATHGYAPRDSDLGIAMTKVTEVLKPRDHGRGPGGA